MAAFREIGTARAVRVPKRPLPGRSVDIDRQPPGIVDTDLEGTNTVYGGPPPLGAYLAPLGPAHLRARVADAQRRRWQKMGYAV